MLQVGLFNAERFSLAPSGQSICRGDKRRQYDVKDGFSAARG
jgi:hypothetical protein